MTRCLQAVRFITGLATLVGGVAVLAPLAADILARQSPTSSNAGDVCAALPAGAIGHAIPDPRAGDTLSAPTDLSRQHVDGEPPQNAPPANAPVYQPPAPPASLPPQPFGMARPAPSLGATYRSTLAVPPPPLLDAHGPPPLAPGWTNRDPRPSVRERSSPLPAVPVTYAVRDGDDLTSLAIRFYGHPAAAGAIFAANQDHLTTPDILPIGLRLRLPPPWAVAAGQSSDDSRTLEPGPGIDRGPTFAPTAVPVQPTSTGQPWLERALVPNPSGGISG